MSTIARPRLQAAERRAALIEAAARVFSRGSYRGTTTSEIARAAGVTEPVLYRHFASKRELYLACVDEAWRGVRALWDEALAAEPDPARWLAAIGYAYLAAQDDVFLVDLWVQALTEASDDPEIRKVARKGYGELVRFVEDVSGLSGKPISQFFARGMLINVIAAMGVRDGGVDWADRLIAGCKDDA
jgi:AcrR family transcriptional regulator